MVQSDLYRRLLRKRKSCLQKLLDSSHSFHLYLLVASITSFQHKETEDSWKDLPQALSEFAKLGNFVEK